VVCAQATDQSKWEDGVVDPFLNWFALGLLFFVVIVLVYGIIAIHDIPARIAHARNHPHQDAIHAAGWISLFMLHLLWPFLWIWAMMYRPDRGWGFAHQPGEPATPKEAVAELEELRHRMAEIEAKLEIKDQVTQLSKGQRRPSSDSQGSLVPAAENSIPATELKGAESPGPRR
jgi:type VI protein secretion system component VasK